MVKLTLPWPPSMNRYWRNVNGRTLLSKAGREYRKWVMKELAGHSQGILSGPVSVEIQVFPPDRRRRDLDNLLKGVLDSMAYAGVYADDSQIECLLIYRCGVQRGGKLVIDVRLALEAMDDSEMHQA